MMLMMLAHIFPEHGESFENTSQNNPTFHRCSRIAKGSAHPL